MQGTISGLVASYGYVVLFFLVGVESLGIPLPGETAVVTAAAWAALGHLSIYAVVATAATGAIIGDNGGYWIGRTGGVALYAAMGASFISAKPTSSAPVASLSGTAPRRSSSAASLRCCVPGPPCSRERHACRTAPSCSITRSAQCVGPALSARSATGSAVICRR